jgi:transcriptional regulator with XRE-family HTH domain
VYEALRSGKRVVLKLSSLDELPGALIQARIAQGLSQKDLARRLGLKEQQIQRYEATDYASASLARLIRVSRALHLKVSAKAWTGNGIRNARSRETL